MVREKPNKSSNDKRTKKVIFGNPNTFAIYVDKVKSWKLDEEINGVAGIYINGKFYLTNHGLISLHNDFLNILEKSASISHNQSVFDLPDHELLKFMLMERYPNWYANSEEDWEKNLDIWTTKQENFSFDLSLESFSIGHVEKFYLFGVRGLDDYIKLIFYIKEDTKDFFDFSSVNNSNVESVVISCKEYKRNIKKLKKFLKENGI